MKQEMIGWKWHQLDHMQIVCNSLQTDNHASTSSLKFFTGRMRFLTPNQQRQSIEGVPYHITPPPYTTTVLQPFFRHHPGEPVPEENFWT